MIIDSKIVNFVGNPEIVMVLGLLIDDRINELKDQLIVADLDRVKGIQTSIQELKRFKNIKDIVLVKRNSDG